MQVDNIYSNICFDLKEERFETILENPQFKIERIVSNGQSTPPGDWYDQDTCEWVILLKGSAGIRFEGSEKTCRLLPGDYIHIPAHVRHRVEWTSRDEETIWLAVHY